jgi:hypothetical protein
LIEFDCVVDSINQIDYGKNEMSNIEKSLTFKVKVKEKNCILNSIEEEFFLRKVVYENGMWKIRLYDIDIKKVIKKYGKLIALNNKNKKKIMSMRPFIEEHYPTQQLLFNVFIKHCEYEFERFVRYKNPFSIIKIHFDINIHQENMEYQLNSFFEEHTRKIDSFSKYDSKIYLLILPETDERKGQLVSKKISELLENHIEVLKGKKIETNVVTCEEEFVSIKEMLEIIEIYW